MRAVTTNLHLFPPTIVLKCHPLLPQVVVTSTRPSDSTPSKAYQEALASFEARLFFRLPEQRASSSSSASTASHAGSYTTPMERQQLQPVGDDHMFHQKVCMGLQVEPSAYFTLLVHW